MSFEHGVNSTALREIIQRAEVLEPNVRERWGVTVYYYRIQLVIVLLRCSTQTSFFPSLGFILFAECYCFCQLRLDSCWNSTFYYIYLIIYSF